MITLIQTLAEIDQLQQTIAQQGPMPQATLRKLNYAFRLRWNYNSNAMEGNTLTQEETRSIMVGNITVNGKPLKDVLEMKKHDDLIYNILNMGRGVLNISEKRIKEIHTGIIHEDDPARSKLIGIWKLTPNYLYNYRGERFDFTAPGQVAEEMHILINWLNAEKEKIARNASGRLHPVLLASMFHLRFATIHPFFDGNGRTARILHNIILVAFGFPPVWIDETERTGYYQYMADVQCYDADPGLFRTFMAGLLKRSLQMVLEPDFPTE